MKIEILIYEFSICKLSECPQIRQEDEFCFVGKTDEEISMVCTCENVPKNAVRRDDGWRAFRIKDVLDFSLVGVLSDISGLLAENGISIFAISTFNTDYVLTKKESFDKALNVLSDAGYLVEGR